LRRDRDRPGRRRADGNIPAALAVPLWEPNRTLGAIYLDSLHDANAFQTSDLELVTAAADLAAVAVERGKAEQRARASEVLRSSLERFHSPDVVNLILAQAEQGEGVKQFLIEREVTILFADICNSTGCWSGSTPRRPPTCSTTISRK